MIDFVASKSPRNTDRAPEKEKAMITVLVIAAFVVAILWLTHDRDGLDFGARDIHRAMAARDRRTGPTGVVVP
ncbi:hypothetical protein [Tsukamurella paurometabola]|uniref:Uncharacterized protein n=1 Tax=Tsukamurella paurometabola TaxID=2061 RepID=A0A3P8KLB8_TSUPA|nr:hypothetical protein [Tsukamurella paurometabola]MBS4100271.1 hypothetical protein [Tsukamurella paurometabola]UEA84300.1 hypothetical protein LK411_05590 [Tsukamurella paurometabola]VDR41478.1 Uncharacterised protein [Tsukamurella paurometabola]